MQYDQYRQQILFESSRVLKLYMTSLQVWSSSFTDQLLLHLLFFNLLFILSNILFWPIVFHLEFLFFVDIIQFIKFCTIKRQSHLNCNYAKMSNTILKNYLPWSSFGCSFPFPWCGGFIVSFLSHCALVCFAFSMALKDLFGTLVTLGIGINSGFLTLRVCSTPFILILNFFGGWSLPQPLSSLHIETRWSSLNMFRSSYTTLVCSGIVSNLSSKVLFLLLQNGSNPIITYWWLLLFSKRTHQFLGSFFPRRFLRYQLLVWYRRLWKDTGEQISFIATIKDYSNTLNILSSIQDPWQVWFLMALL